MQYEDNIPQSIKDFRNREAIREERVQASYEEVLKLPTFLYQTNPNKSIQSLKNVKDSKYHLKTPEEMEKKNQELIEKENFRKYLRNPEESFSKKLKPSEMQYVSGDGIKYHYNLESQYAAKNPKKLPVPVLQSEYEKELKLRFIENERRKKIAQAGFGLEGSLPEWAKDLPMFSNLSESSEAIADSQLEQVQSDLTQGDNKAGLNLKKSPPLRFNPSILENVPENLPTTKVVTVVGIEIVKIDVLLEEISKFGKIIYYEIENGTKQCVHLLLETYNSAEILLRMGEIELSDHIKIKIVPANKVIEFKLLRHLPASKPEIPIDEELVVENTNTIKRKLHVICDYSQKKINREDTGFEHSLNDDGLKANSLLKRFWNSFFN